MRLDASQAFGRRMHATRCEIVGLPLGEHSRVLMIVLTRSYDLGTSRTRVSLALRAS